MSSEVWLDDGTLATITTAEIQDIETLLDAAGKTLPELSALGMLVSSAAVG